MVPCSEKVVTASLEAAVAEWTALLGPAWVDTTADRCGRLEKATFRTTGHVLAHLRPGTVDEVAECLRIASRHGVQLNVFSRGRNYGYSSCGPANCASASMELSRLDAITEFDDGLGYVRIQAGVTFAQLGEFLASRGSSRILPSTGGPPDGSILANTVERGHGMGYGGDRYLHSCRYEIVTAQGERFETGFGRFENARIANVMRSGVGPSLDGLFTQSSLGIVTAITIWLPRRPKYHTAVLLPTPARERIGILFECIGEAARQGLVRDGSGFAMGAYKLATIMLRREDFGPAGTPLGWDALRRHSKRWGHAQWFLGVSLEADSKALLRAKEKALRAIFRPQLQRKERLVFLTAFRARLARVAAGLLPGPLADVVRQIVDVFYERTPLLGHRIEQPLTSVYWAKPRAQVTAYSDPHLDDVGLLWVSVPVPLRGREITDVCRIIDEGLMGFGFEPSTQVTLVSERVVRVITALMYDRAVPGQDEQAILCQKAVYAELERLGYYTYRLQPHLMEQYAGLGSTHQTVNARIKHALDPKGVLDPSRYPASVSTAVGTETL